MKSDVRARNLGWVTPPLLDSGPKNALTDVPGVLVEHTTINKTFQVSANLEGLHCVRTGVTAIRPHPGTVQKGAVAVANWWSRWRNDRRLEWITKPLVTLLFIMAALVIDMRPQRANTIRGYHMTDGSWINWPS